MLSRAVKRAMPAASVQKANDEASLHEHATAESLLLVNRVLDGAFVDDDGVSLIRRLASQPNAPALMLVSNRAEAQTEAERAGAWPGFGKDTMRAPETADRLRAAMLGGESAATARPADDHNTASQAPDAEAPDASP